MSLYYKITFWKSFSNSFKINSSFKVEGKECIWKWSEFPIASFGALYGGGTVQAISHFLPGRVYNKSLDFDSRQRPPERSCARGVGKRGGERGGVPMDLLNINRKFVEAEALLKSWILEMWLELILLDLETEFACDQMKRQQWAATKKW